jgi:hypothetical protein
MLPVFSKPKEPPRHGWRNTNPALRKSNRYLVGWERRKQRSEAVFLRKPKSDRYSPEVFPTLIAGYTTPLVSFDNAEPSPRGKDYRVESSAGEPIGNYGML